jgi:acetylglutamate kinase
VVIKYGGAAMSDPALREDFARDVVLLKYVGMNPIVVHGGGPDITRYMERLDMPVEFVGGLRVSDADTVEIAKMVLVGKVNKDIVLRLGRHGQPAVGLCGDDGCCSASRRGGPDGEDIGYVGGSSASTRRHPPRRGGLHPGHRVRRRRPRRPLAQRQRRRGGRARSRGRSAPTRSIFLTDVPGWLRDPADPAP